MLMLLCFANVLITGLTAGGLAFMTQGVSTATPKLGRRTFTELHQGLCRFADPLMPVQVCASVLTGAALALLHFIRGEPTAAILALVGGVGLAAVIAITVIVNKPINELVDSWSPTRPPDEWVEVRERWNRFHRRRTILCLLGFPPRRPQLLSL